MRVKKMSRIEKSLVKCDFNNKNLRINADFFLPLR